MSIIENTIATISFKHLSLSLMTLGCSDSTSEGFVCPPGLDSGSCAVLKNAQAQSEHMARGDQLVQDCQASGNSKSKACKTLDAYNNYNVGMARWYEAQDAGQTILNNVRRNEIDKSTRDDVHRHKQNLNECWARGGHNC